MLDFASWAQVQAEILGSPVLRNLAASSKHGSRG